MVTKEGRRVRVQWLFGGNTKEMVHLPFFHQLQHLLVIYISRSILYRMKVVYQMYIACSLWTAQKRSQASCLAPLPRNYARIDTQRQAGGCRHHHQQEKPRH